MKSKLSKSLKNNKKWTKSLKKNKYWINVKFLSAIVLVTIVMVVFLWIKFMWYNWENEIVSGDIEHIGSNLGSSGPGRSSSFDSPDCFSFEISSFCSGWVNRWWIRGTWKTPSWALTNSSLRNWPPTWPITWASTGSNYLFLETSKSGLHRRLNMNVPRSIKLELPQFELTANTRFSFDYNMRWASIGELKVEAVIGSTSNELFKKSSDQGDGWKSSGYIDIPWNPWDNVIIKIFANSLVGNFSYKWDIAIDNVRITELDSQWSSQQVSSPVTSPQDPPAQDPPAQGVVWQGNPLGSNLGSSGPGRSSSFDSPDCFSFEISSFCSGWVNRWWIRGTWKTPSWALTNSSLRNWPPTWPITWASTGSNYLFLETSKSGLHRRLNMNVPRSIKLELPQFELTANTRFSFDYNMRWASIGELKVEAVIGSTSNELFKKSSDQGDGWKSSGYIDIPWNPWDNVIIKIFANSLVGNFSYKWDIAIDNVRITELDSQWSSQQVSSPVTSPQDPPAQDPPAQGVVWQGNPQVASQPCIKGDVNDDWVFDVEDLRRFELIMRQAPLGINAHSLSQPFLINGDLAPLWRPDWRLDRADYLIMTRALNWDFDVCDVRNESWVSIANISLLVSDNIDVNGKIRAEEICFVGWNCSTSRNPRWAKIQAPEGWKIMFLTSQVYTWDLWHPYWANGICNGHASAWNLTWTYKAWIGSPAYNYDPARSFTHSQKPYYVNRWDLWWWTKLADNWDDLITKKNSIWWFNFDEYANKTSNAVFWNNVKFDGTVYDITNSQHCENWTNLAHNEFVPWVSPTSEEFGTYYGYYSYATVGIWTPNSGARCSDRKHLLCVQQ